MPVIRLLWRYRSFINTNVGGMGVRREGGKTGISPLEIGTKKQKFLKREISILILISWVNSCNNSLFADMTLTLQKSHVHCSGSLICSDELAVH